MCPHRYDVSQICGGRFHTHIDGRTPVQTKVHTFHKTICCHHHITGGPQDCRVIAWADEHRLIHGQAFGQRRNEVELPYLANG